MDTQKQNDLIDYFDTAASTLALLQDDETRVLIIPARVHRALIHYLKGEVDFTPLKDSKEVQELKRYFNDLVLGVLSGSLDVTGNHADELGRDDDFFNLNLNAIDLIEQASQRYLAKM